MMMVRGSGIVYRLHCVTLTAFTASESSLKRICLVAAAAALVIQIAYYHLLK